MKYQSGLGNRGSRKGAAWKPGELPGRVTMLAGVFFLSMLAIQVRLIQLQVFRASELGQTARSQQERTIRLDPKRGSIFDRNGRELALSVDVDSVYADPTKVRHPAKTARQLASALRLRTRDVRAKLTSDKRFVWIKRKITPSTRKALERCDIPGVGFVKESKRYYPKGTLAAHVVGNTGVDNQGLGGIEYALNREVCGKPGHLLALRDGRGGYALRFDERLPAAGRSVVLALDEVIQHFVERELDVAMSRSRAKAATVIVMRPDSGEILALANRPTFDPNSYSRYPEEARINRAIGTIYEPGSTFKVVTVGAALEEKKVTPQTVIDCEHGSILVGRHRIDEDRIPFDYLSVEQIVEKSSNVGAVKLALMMSPEVFYRHLTNFGFGVETGIDLPGESKGLLRAPSDWSGLSQASLAIGQEVGVTPLQSLTAVAAVANGGIQRRPWIVAGLIGEDGSVSRTVASAQPGRRIISRETAEALTRMLERVVTQGTGKAAAVPGYRVAGKTGTGQKVDESQRYARGKYVASFVGFVPVEDPVLAIIVVVDEPRRGSHGGTVAAPVFSRIALASLQYLGVMPEENGVVLNRGSEIRTSLRRFESMPTLPYRAVFDRSEQNPARAARFVPLTRSEPRRPEVETHNELHEMPDLSGVSLRKAISLLAQMGVEFRIRGEGPTVGRQSPRPGTEVSPGTLCTLTLTRGRP